MPLETYPVIEVAPEWALEPEALGSKQKFWYRDSEGGNRWLFKYPQASTGQHWAEKIAAELANRMGILHATVELAEIGENRGSATESFARGGRELYHGNQILAGKVLNYNPEVRFHQSGHTLANIFLALDRTFTSEEGAKKAKEQMAGYLVLDALIGNTDRHHENWGILRKRVGDVWWGIVAPSFDHASSLGRELLDAGSTRSREGLLRAGRVGIYAEKGRGGVYWATDDGRGPSPIELVRRATREHQGILAQALNKIRTVDEPTLDGIIEQVPRSWMSPTARQFALTLMMYNLQELRKLLP